MDKVKKYLSTAPTLLQLLLEFWALFILASAFRWLANQPNTIAVMLGLSGLASCLLLACSRGWMLLTKEEKGNS